MLQPLDLLLDKSRYRAVDRVIPGYFTHVGVYLGSAAELRARGLWEHPLVVPHRAAIEGGATIREAIRSGVRLTTLEQFLYLDDLALLRPPELPASEAEETVLRGFREIGKRYDFNFDLESTDRMVCSELVYPVFPNLTWPTGSMLGRNIVTPDHVARMAAPRGPLELVRFYYDGRLLDGEAGATLARLVSQPR